MMGLRFLSDTNKVTFKDRLSLLLVFIVGLLFYGYEFFLRLINGAYEPQIYDYFKIHSNIDYSFLISSYSISYLIMQIPCGFILDRFQSRYVFAFAILLCGIGNIIFLCPMYWIALVGRLLVGFGSAFAFIGVLKISREYFNDKNFSLFASIAISFGTFAGISSQQISVFLLKTGFDWRLIFLVVGILSVPLALISFLVLSKNSNKKDVSFFKGYAAANYISLIKNELIWLNAIWGGLIYIPTVILTAQYGVKFFSDIHGMNQYDSVKLVSCLLLGWVIFSPIMVFISKYIGVFKTVFFSVILSLFLLTSLTINSDINSFNITSLVFILGCFSASQVLVWQLFNKFCKPEFTALGIAVTNMIITGVTELGQLFSGYLMDSTNFIDWLKSLNYINYVIQVNIVIFILSILLGVIVFMVTVKLCNAKGR